MFVNDLNIAFLNLRGYSYKYLDDSIYDIPYLLKKLSSLELSNETVRELKEFLNSNNFWYGLCVIFAHYNKNKKIITLIKDKFKYLLKKINFKFDLLNSRYWLMYDSIFGFLQCIEQLTDDNWYDDKYWKYLEDDNLSKEENSKILNKLIDSVILTEMNNNKNIIRLINKCNNNKKKRLLKIAKFNKKKFKNCCESDIIDKFIDLLY